MSQHSFVVPDESGAAFLPDLNNALQALASVSRGASAPATTYAGQYWEDTGNSILRRRDAANGAWVIVGSLDETAVVSRGSNSILINADWGKTFLASGTFTQTFTAAAVLGDNWHVFYRNDGSGVITLDPNGAETIDGFTTLALQPGESCRIACNGSAFKTQGLAQPRMFVRRKTADESVTSSTALQDDDHLTFPIAANEEWTVSYEIGCGNGLNPTGVKIAITVPSGASLLASAIVGADQGSALGQSTTTSGSAILLFTPSAGAATGYIKAMAWVLNGTTPGNVTLQWAQNSSSGTALTFKKGSFLQASRVA